MSKETTTRIVGTAAPGTPADTVHLPPEIYDPWADLAARPQVQLIWQSVWPVRLRGATDGERIWLRSDLSQVEARCVLARELEHIKPRTHGLAATGGRASGQRNGSLPTGAPVAHQGAHRLGHLHRRARGLLSGHPPSVEGEDRVPVRRPAALPTWPCADWVG